ncbi:hypothetical protein LTR56_002166 [Elasticomyces elasticus]|nr:hypothetical protein LTR56_002166 [Elasticomyces elasticus]KAK3666045.1 hypothetical protein LTR22_003048 [Elasticomyces elasticus]KAK4929532.1 hypothetical protein LTR49_003827 [Elasticomyces elasticus]KAK5767510.1 hypothetical protein LTS12_002351 [Elasticomyces elasticus]
MFDKTALEKLGTEAGCATPVLEWNENGSIFDGPVSSSGHGIFDETVSKKLDLESGNATISADVKYDASNSTSSEILSEQLEIKSGSAGMQYNTNNSTSRIYGGNTSIPMKLNSWISHWHIFDAQGRAVGFRTYDPEEPVWTPEQFAERLQGLSAEYEEGRCCDEDERMRARMHDRCAFEDGEGPFDPRVLLQRPEWSPLHPFRLQEDVDGYVEVTGRKDSAVDLGPRASGTQRAWRVPDGRYTLARHRGQDVQGAKDVDEVVHEWLEAQRRHVVRRLPTPAPTEHYSNSPTSSLEPKLDATPEVPAPVAIEEYLLAYGVEWKGMGLEAMKAMVKKHFDEDGLAEMGRRMGVGLAAFEAEVTPPPPMRGLREIGQGRAEPNVLTGNPGMCGSASPTRSEMESEPEQQRSSVPAQRSPPRGNKLPAVKRWNGRPALQPRAAFGSNSGMTPEEWVEHRRKGKNESQKMKRKEQRERKAKLCGSL